MGWALIVLVAASLYALLALWIGRKCEEMSRDYPSPDDMSPGKWDAA
jgi:hypothetical protein